MQGRQQARRADETRGEMIIELGNGIRKLLRCQRAQPGGHEVQCEGQRVARLTAAICE